MIASIARRALWLPLAVFLAHVALMAGTSVHARVPWLDVPTHLLGGLAIAYFFARSLDVLEETGIVEDVGVLLRAILVFGLTCAAAVFWEFFEYLADHGLGTGVQKGVEDTLSDMLFGIVGGVAFLASGRAGPRPRG